MKKPKTIIFEEKEFEAITKTAKQKSISTSALIRLAVMEYVSLNLKKEE